MKSKAAQSALMLATIMAMSSEQNRQQLGKEEELQQKRVKKLVIKPGLKEFIIEGKSYWTINEKNAIRKHLASKK